MRKAGADEIISAGAFSTLLLAQTSLVHGLSTIYKNLLTISEETNEIYLVNVPENYIGKNFSELGATIYMHRDDKNPIILIGVKSDERVFLNPKPSEFKNFKRGDKAIIISFERPHKLIKGVTNES